MRYLSALTLLALFSTPSFAAAPADFNADVLPVFRKYCVGCHNGTEANGGLVLEDHARALKGGDNGAVLIAGESAKSKLWLAVSGQAEPQMPPKDSPQPKAEEIAVIQSWIDGGAKPPAKGPAGLVTPKIDPIGNVREPVTALAADPQGRWLAIARPAGVEIWSRESRDKSPEPEKTPGDAIAGLPSGSGLSTLVSRLAGHTGAVADIQVSADGKWLIVAAGEIGLGGEATLWNTTDWSRGPVISGHRDALYSAAMSPDGQTLATASYDKEIHAWDIASGKLKTSMLGHNDAVFSLAFHPVHGRILASASGDRTVKLWDVASGNRLDTFGQPTKEQNSAAFSPDGRFVAAGGADNRVRVWSLSESAKEGTNPLLYARFAHEAAVLKVLFSPDGRLLVSSSQDLRIKVWETQTFTQIAMFDHQPDWAAALAFSPDSRTLYVGRMDGSVSAYTMKPEWGDKPNELERLSEAVTPGGVATTSLPESAEVEPNNEPNQAMPVAWPAVVSGVLNGPNGQPDGDLYRLQAQAGQTWILETNAARSGSPADTKLEVLDADGRPVVRALLQAVRDSWVNFRPIDSNSGDVRLEFWEEMDINQLLYMNGEVTKLFRAPRGPDSAWSLYSNQGKRRCFFDTSAVGQAKDQPAYIVEAFPPGSSIVENGLPVFPLYYLNEDDGERELGNDSRLTFTAPSDGDYLIRVSDTRDFSGESYKYTLTVRPPRPDFVVKADTQNLKVPAGSGQRVTFSVDRIDNAEGDLRIEVANVPPGYHITSPIIIQSGHVTASGVLTAESSAQQVPKETWEQLQMTAKSEIGGQLVEKPVGHLGEITLEEPAAIRVALEPDNPEFTDEDGGLLIVPGTTITARLKVERNGYDGDVRCDVDGLPHGIIVDNIGLSGILVRANETERQIFLTARPWVPATVHLIDTVAQTQGNQASPPIRLQVK